jgi:hypothetical protein
LEGLIDKVARLVEALKIFRGYRFISSSLCLLYDSSNPGKSDARLIDFGRVVEEKEGFIDADSV